MFNFCYCWKKKISISCNCWSGYTLADLSWPQQEFKACVAWYFASSFYLVSFGVRFCSYVRKKHPAFVLLSICCIYSCTLYTVVHYSFLRLAKSCFVQLSTILDLKLCVLQFNVCRHLLLSVSMSMSMSMFFSESSMMMLWLVNT